MEALTEPVVTKARGGADELPPLGGVVLHGAVRPGDEDRGVWVESRRVPGRHDAHDCYSEEEVGLIFLREGRR